MLSHLIFIVIIWEWYLHSIFSIIYSLSCRVNHSFQLDHSKDNLTMLKSLPTVTTQIPLCPSITSSGYLFSLFPFTARFHEGCLYPTSSFPYLLFLPSPIPIWLLLDLCIKRISVINDHHHAAKINGQFSVLILLLLLISQQYLKLLITPSFLTYPLLNAPAFSPASLGCSFSVSFEGSILDLLTYSILFPWPSSSMPIAPVTLHTPTAS